MRHPLLAALILGSATTLLMSNGGIFSSTAAVTGPAAPAAAPAAQPCDRSCDPAWMDSHLRLNQVQLLGTDASYKLKPERSALTIIRMGGRDGADILDFGQPALAAQLDADVRVLSFDLVNDPQGGAFRNPAIAGMSMTLLADDYVAAMKQPGYKVMHVPDVDYGSSCLALKDCLRQVAAWSKAHPRHLPILLSLRPTDDKTPIPGAVTPPAIDAAALQGLETEIRSVFAESDLITPAQVQGRHASLREAVQSEGWPLLGATRGKIMILLDGKKAGAYRGKLMFAVGAPDGAVLMVNDARRDRGRIAAALRQDLLVMTRADDDTHEARRGDSSRREAAFASGAQVVLTDFIRPDPAIGPYHVTLAELHQARCGAMLGTEKCVRLLEAQTVTASLP